MNKISLILFFCANIFASNIGVKALEKQCDDGDLRRCASLGVMLRVGKYTEQNYPKSLNLLKKACDGGEKVGCYNLGLMYQNAQGVKQDNKKAQRLFKKACDGGEKVGCYNLGLMYQNAQGVKQDNKKAQRLFKKACDGGLSNACNALAKKTSSPTHEKASKRDLVFEEPKSSMSLFSLLFFVGSFIFLFFLLIKFLCKFPVLCAILTILGIGSLFGD